MFENIALSFQGIWNHKTRSFLTMLGIIIGIAAIITIVSTIEGTNNQIKQNLVGAGTNVVDVRISRTDDGYIDLDYGGKVEGVRPLTEADREELLKQPGVEDVSFYVHRDYAENVYYLNSGFDGRVYGVDAHYFDVNSYSLWYGRDFIEQDFKERRKVAIIDSRLVKGLFGGRDPIGEILEFKGEPFTVVGVVEQKKNNAVVINSIADYEMYADHSSGAVFVPM